MPIAVDIEPDMLAIEVNEPALKDEHVTALDQVIQTNGRFPMIYLNCSAVMNVADSAVERFRALTDRLSVENGQNFILIGSEALWAAMKKDGAASADSSSVGFGHIVLPSAASRASVDDETTVLANVFVQGHIQAISQYAGGVAPVQLGRDETSPANALGNGAVISTAEFSTANLNGRIVLSFPAPAFLRIISQVMGGPQSELSPDLVDFSGEFVNVATAMARESLRPTRYPITVGLPKVLAKEEFEKLLEQKDLKATQFELAFEGEKFALGVLTWPKVSFSETNLFDDLLQ